MICLMSSLLPSDYTDYIAMASIFKYIKVCKFLLCETFIFLQERGLQSAGSL